VEKDVPRALELHARACADGEPYGCTNRGWLLVHAVEPPQDELGRQVLEQACLDEPRGCGHLGSLILAREGRTATGRAPAAVVDLFGRACEGGSSLGCKNLGSVRDEAGEHAGAVEAWRSACRGAEAEGCFRLGLALDRGVGVGRSPGEATAQFERCCHMRFGAGCRELGRQWLEGEGVDPSADEEGRRRQAIDALRQACELEDAAGCRLLGDARGRAEDAMSRAGAADAWHRGCQLGDGEACRALGKRFDDGRLGEALGEVQRRQRAAELFGRGCELGYGPACADLEQAETPEREPGPQ